MPGSVACVLMRAVAFDAMGVLYRSADDLVDLLMPFARANGSRLSDEEIGIAYRSASRGEMTSAELWHRLAVAGDPTELDRLYLAAYQLTPGMLPLADELRERGVPLACITNDIAEWSRALRMRFELDRRIAHWTVSAEVGARKPDERIYRAFVRASGFAPEDVIVVDDRARNVEAAATLGFATIHVDLASTSTSPGSIRSVDELRAALLDATRTRRSATSRATHRTVISVPDALRRVLDLLPAPVHEVRGLRGPAGPWLIRYGSEEAVLRWSDPAQHARLGFTPALALESMTWLHEFLGDLAATGHVAPGPVNDLGGHSLAVVDGAIWELLTYVRGRQMAWEDGVYEAGRALAQFHVASMGLPPRPQRPGALPFDACRPLHPSAPVAEVQRELGEIGYSGAERCVIHGDATFGNVVIAQDGTWRLIDFAIAFHDVPLADIACALWRTGRTADAATSYDPARAAEFVRGYASLRPLRPDDARAIVVYVKARGLQLQHRSELRGWRTDETVIQRLLALRAQQGEIESAIRTALRSQASGVATS